MDLSTFKDTTQTPPPTPGEDDKEINKVASETLLTDAVTKLANVPSTDQDPHTPPPSPSYLARGDSTDAAFYPLTNSGSTDSAVSFNKIFYINYIADFCLQIQSQIIIYQVLNLPSIY